MVTTLEIENDDPSMEFDRGIRYLNGDGVPQDDTRAAECFQKAAEGGFTEASFILGVMYGNGQGVSRDIGKAEELLNPIARSGHAAAQCHLGLMYLDGNGVPRYYVEAYKWLNLAAAQGDLVAKRKLAALENVMSKEQVAEAQRKSVSIRKSRMFSD